MKLSQLSLADYNQLDSIPVINQDLTASGFTPVANTYYRHTGTGGGTPAPVNPYIVNQDASNQYINAAFDPMSNISQFVFDGQIGHMLGYNEDGIISDVIRMVKIADGHYQLQYTVDGETYQAMWDNTLPDPWSGLKQIGTLERDKVYYWKSDTGNASMVENQNVWGAYISKDGQWTSGGSAYTTGAIYYYNDTAYHKLGESGGTTLNRYTYSIGEQASENAIIRVRNIVLGSKVPPRARFIMSSDWQWHEIVNVSDHGYWVITRCYEGYDTVNIVETYYIWNYRSNSYTALKKRQNIDTGETTTTKNEYAYGTKTLDIVYYNDVEIT